MLKNLRKSNTRQLLLAIPTALLAMCNVGCPGANMPAPSTGETVSFSDDIQPIFNTNCTVCHVTGGIAGDRVHLVDTESYDGLIDQPSSQRSDLTLVVPGSSSDSLLFLKVSTDSPPVGRRMPLVGTPLSAADLGVIRDWIDQGASNN